MDNVNEQNHQPDPAFAARLRWQLASELRRIRRFGGGSPRFSSPKRAFALLVALVTGFAVATAAQSYQDSAKAVLLEAREEAAVELTQARLELARSYLEELEFRERSDPELRDTLLSTRFQLRRIERELHRAELNLQEVRRSGQAPRDELTAPLVGGRDFVTERLGLDLAAELEREAIFEDELSGFEGSRADELTVSQLAFQLASVREGIAKLRDRLRVRRDYLAGELTSQEVAFRSEWLSIRERLPQAELRVEMVRRELERTRRALEVGESDPREVKQLEFVLLEAETEARLARLEHDFLLRRILGNQ